MGMNKSTFGAFVLMFAGASFVAPAGEALAQGGTTPQSPSMSGARSGSAIDSDQGTGARRDPHSGTMVPDPGQSRSFEGMAQVPAGIGERGTGQTQSTLERSGGGQSRSSQGKASDMSAGIGERGTGETQSTQEQRSGGEQSRSPQGMASVPPAE